VDRWGCGTQRSGEDREIFGVAGEDVVSQTECTYDEVCVDDIGGVGLGKETPHGPGVVERMDGDGLQERRQSGLSRPISPDLGYDGVSGVERCLGSLRCCEENTGAALAAVDGDEESGVKNHKPYRWAMAVISSLPSGPASASHSARKEDRSRWR